MTIEAGTLVTQPNFEHLRVLTGAHGLYEHALHAQPRIEHGYTTDDNARALVVLTRARGLGFEVDLEPYLGFVVGGAVAGGWHNRMAASGEWEDRRGSDDCHGRAIWGLGETIASGAGGSEAGDAFQAGVHNFASIHHRSIAYAILGVVPVLPVAPEPLLEEFLQTSVSKLPRPRVGDWRWPEDRLTYDNARIPQAMIEAGLAMNDQNLTQSGLDLLEWLVETETGTSGFSFTPVGGRGPGDPKPAFDQQPIEAWAMVDACVTAYVADPNPTWKSAAIRAANWFHGENDGGHRLYDPETGAGYDGLHADGVNQNRGAESTLSALGAIVGHLRLLSLSP